MSFSFADTVKSMKDCASRNASLHEINISNDIPDNSTYKEFLSEMQKSYTENIIIQNGGIKGDRLDDFLKAISNNKDIHKINLYKNELDDEDLKKISEFSLKNSHVTSYSLSNNNYSNTGCLYLAKAIEKGANIKILNIANCPDVTVDMVDVFVPLLKDISLKMHTFSVGVTYGVDIERKIWSANHVRKHRFEAYRKTKELQKKLGLNDPSRLACIASRSSHNSNTETQPQNRLESVLASKLHQR